MKVSTRVEYGVLALADIAMYSENGTSVSTLDISEREGISKKYLEQILLLLRQAGLVRAQKGVHGGYSLSKSEAEITMADVLNALDSGVLDPMEVPGKKESGELRFAVNECLWGRINGYLSAFAEGVTIAEFIRECRENMSSGWDMYVI